MDRTERFYRIRQLLATRQVVPISAFLSALSVSRATFTRDIEYLRDRLNVPVVWDRERRGYRLAQDGATELPGVWLSAEEIRALLAMEGLLEAMQSGVLRSHLAPVRSRLEAMASSQGLELAALQRRVRVVDSLPRQTDACVVTTVLGATIDRRRIDVEHYNRERGEVLTRQLSPQTVLFYRNAWYVHAWCHLREAASVVGISPEAYRQRLSRARSRLDAFMSKACGLANSEAACRCERQLPVVRHLAKVRAPDSGAVVALHKPELDEAERHFAAFTRLTDAAAILRAHPDYRAPEAQRAAILAVLRQEGFMQRGQLQ